MEKLIMNRMTWPELAAELEHIKVALVPVGSCEQHGPNTTFATDAARAEAYAERLAERCGNKVVVFPCVNYGLSLHHMDFPGTVTLRVKTMMSLLEDIGVAIAQHGIKKILFLNAHGGNFPALEGAVITLKQEHGIEAYWSAIGFEISLGGLTGLPKLIGHACEVETSSCMYLCPEVVREKREKGQVQDSMLTHDSFIKGGAAGQPQLTGHFALVDRIVLHHLAVLTVRDHDFMELFGGFQGIPHPNCRGNGYAVVGKRHGAGLSQLVKIRQHFALLSNGYGADGEHMAEALIFSLFQHIFHLLRGVQHGLGVGHAGHGGKAACRRCGAAGDDVLLIGKAGIPEVDVHIYKARGKIQPGAVDDLMTLGGDPRRQCGDGFAFHQQIHGCGSQCDRIDDKSIF